jgi:hypothetical protein
MFIDTEEDGGHKNDKPNKTEEEHIQDDAHRIGKNNQSEAKLGKWGYASLFVDELIKKHVQFNIPFNLAEV